MKPHRWVKSNSKGWPVWCKEHEPDTYNNPHTMWVVCLGCGANVVCLKTDFPDKCHEDWVPADCNETIVMDVMEE